MNIVYAGTPEFAATILEALLASRHRVVGAFTQPDRPAGRGRRLAPSPVKQVCNARRIPVYQPRSFKDSCAVATLADIAPQVIVIAAYGLMLPQVVLDIPALGCINVHPSLLPRWRGAAPIQRSIQAGDNETGVAIMQMDTGLDTGPVLATARCAISDRDTAATLHTRLAALGADALIDTLDALDRGPLTASPQEEERACYAARIEKTEALIDWRQPAATLARQVRAFNPWPVAYTTLAPERTKPARTQRLRVWMARPLGGSVDDSPGTVAVSGPEGIRVISGEGELLLEEIQADGGRRMPAADYLNAHPIGPGTRLGAASKN